MDAVKTTQIKANCVRYIKLGRKGTWESECFEKGIIRLGFRSQEYVSLFPSNDWEKKIISCYQDKNKGTITNYLNQVRSFFLDDGQTLWITFSKRKMWWAFVDPSQSPVKHSDGNGTYRKTLSGWQSKDINGKLLDVSVLSGNLTKTAGFKGTICELGNEAGCYALRRINAIQTPSVEKAEKLCEELCLIIVEMMRQLTPKDFELLVDLVFTTSGWRRLSIVGGTEKTIDMELVLPTTGEKAFIQVKTETNQTEFDDEYLDTFQEMSQFGRMFFVYHTAKKSVIKCDEEKVTIIDAEQLAKMVLDAGLISWLVEKAR
ncbi:MAG TPA: hypothetical protein DCY07_08550 [Rhodospirillaceae bacterium]|nr:hypothetical protein [Rhodospirillaceae bacterium]